MTSLHPTERADFLLGMLRNLTSMRDPMVVVNTFSEGVRAAYQPNACFSSEGSSSNFSVLGCLCGNAPRSLSTIHAMPKLRQYREWLHTAREDAQGSGR